MAKLLLEAVNIEKHYGLRTVLDVERFELFDGDRIGLVASTIMGSSETIFYTMTVYLGAAGVKKLPHVMWASMAAYLLSAALTGWLL
jgi:spore maturation protein SpmB